MSARIPAQDWHALQEFDPALLAWQHLPEPPLMMICGGPVRKEE